MYCQTSQDAASCAVSQRGRLLQASRTTVDLWRQNAADSSACSAFLSAWDVAFITECLGRSVHAMKFVVITDVLVPIVVVLVPSLIGIYVSGAWRKYGHRMERLYELASKLPPDSPVRQRFQAAADEEAQRVAEQELNAQPLRVLLAKRYLVLLASLLGLVLLISVVRQEGLAFSVGLIAGAVAGTFKLATTGGGEAIAMAILLVVLFATWGSAAVVIDHRRTKRRLAIGRSSGPGSATASGSTSASRVRPG